MLGGQLLEVVGQHAAEPSVRLPDGWIIALAVVTGLIANSRTRARREVSADEQLANGWSNFCIRRRSDPRGRVAQVLWLEWQPRPKGTAAVLRWLDSGEVFASWWHMSPGPLPGEVYALLERRLRTGHYEPPMDVNFDDIVDSVNVACQPAWTRDDASRKRQDERNSRLAEPTPPN